MAIETAFQYTLPQIIIRHQTLLSNALIRISHHNEICPLSKNLLPTTPDFARLPLEAGHTGSYYWHSPVNQTASWKKDQFPPMHFLIITLSRLQTIIWICHALFALPLNCIIHEWSQRFAETRRRGELLWVDLSLKYKVFTYCGPLPQKII